MNLAKLFETQKILRDRIEYAESDRFDKLVLSLLVELGECANEWRGFKFWSHKPASPKKITLEEYVDVLHFILEIGLELGYQPEWVGSYKHYDITTQFKDLFFQVSNFNRHTSLNTYIVMFARFIGLGELLGFKWEEVETAYFEKNKINHQRQDNGY